MAETYEEIIARNRAFTRDFDTMERPTDQQERRPQPPLCKAAMASESIKLPTDFRSLAMQNDMLTLLRSRESRREFTDQPISLLTLSYLLWATQGIKSIFGKNYATLRTVPCGGARHEFETYLAIRRVEGLTAGAYHYLPMTHALERIGDIPDYDKAVSDSLLEQSWGAKGNVVFYWAMVPYRAEWRYGTDAHRVALIDVGHIGQNLYLACESVHLGTCGVAAVDWRLCGDMFRLKSEEEYVVYSAPVGTYAATSRRREDSEVYAFVKDEPGAAQE